MIKNMTRMTVNLNSHADELAHAGHFMCEATYNIKPQED